MSEKSKLKVKKSLSHDVLSTRQYASEVGGKLKYEMRNAKCAGAYAGTGTGRVGGETNTKRGGDGRFCWNIGYKKTLEVRHVL